MALAHIAEGFFKIVALDIYDDHISQTKCFMSKSGNQCFFLFDTAFNQRRHFGIFGFISVFFLKALWWIYGIVGNYGTAIILLTVGIRIVLFPLMHTSTVSMRKMAKVQPKVKEIQAKYKKKKNDPQARSKMSQA